MTATLELARTAGRTTFRLARPAVSGPLRLRGIAVCLALAVMIFLASCVSITIGDYPIGLVDVIRALGGAGNQGDLFIVRELRLPRAMVGLLVGAAFGMSGAVFQTVTRNPLASPDVIGITTGAQTAVVAGIVLGFGAGLGTQTLGLVGGLATALAIYLLAWGHGTTGYRIVLVGIGVSWMCTAATHYLLVKAEIGQAQAALGWLVGTLNARSWEHLRPLALAMAVLVPAALLLTRWLRTLELGDDLARGLGVPVGTARLALLGTAVGLIAFGTAAAGPILFVALTAPQIAQRLCRAAWPPLVASALSGSLIVLVGDLIARQLRPDTELPLGSVTGVLGGLFLLWLLARTHRTG